LHCKRCGYSLGELGSRHCPECGRWFDPRDTRTFRADRPLGPGQWFQARPRVFWAVFAVIAGLTATACWWVLDTLGDAFL